MADGVTLASDWLMVSHSHYHDDTSLSDLARHRAEREQDIPRPEPEQKYYGTETRSIFSQIYQEFRKIYGIINRLKFQPGSGRVKWLPYMKEVLSCHDDGTRIL